MQLFLLHIDDIISGMADKEPHGGLLGSTSVVCDQENKVDGTNYLFSKLCSKMER